MFRVSKTLVFHYYLLSATHVQGLGHIHQDYKITGQVNKH